jgi:hypothetical protein
MRRQPLPTRFAQIKKSSLQYNIGGVAVQLKDAFSNSAHDLLGWCHDVAEWCFPSQHSFSLPQSGPSRNTTTNSRNLAQRVNHLLPSTLFSPTQFYSPHKADFFPFLNLNQAKQPTTKRASKEHKHGRQQLQP